MNKIVLIGNLTHDPETRSTASGVTVCSFTIAVNRRFASQGGEKQTDFFRINAWRQLGDVCSSDLRPASACPTRPASRSHRRCR